MQKLTKAQAVILTGFTGTMVGDFSDFHKDVELRLGRPVYTHEFADPEFGEMINELYREDFLKISPHTLSEEYRS